MSATSARPRVGPRIPTKWVTIILFLLPALALYLVFVLIPVVNAAHYSLYKWNGLQPLDDFIGLKNYATAFGSDAFKTAVSQQLLDNRALAVDPDPVLARARRPAEPAVPRPGDIPAHLLPAVRPLGGHHRHRLLAVAAARGARGQRHEQRRPGWPRAGLAGRHHDRDVHAVRHHLVEVLRLPHDPAAGRLQGIPREIEEAALIDGAGRWQAFRHITLPLLGPTMRVSVFLSMIGALQLFDMIWVMTRGGPSAPRTRWPYSMFKTGFIKPTDRLRKRLAVILFLFALVLALAYQRLVLRRDIEGAVTASTGSAMTTTVSAGNRARSSQRQSGAGGSRRVAGIDVSASSATSS